MARDDLAQVSGVVTEALSGGIFAIQLENGRNIKAKLCGKMRKFRIRVIVGDRVTVGLSPYDLTHGLILTREKLDGPPPPSN
jgi:translation initiation factor IF-1